MPFWPRFVNSVRKSHLQNEIDEELRTHFEEAVRVGRLPGEVRKAFGSPLLRREQSMDLKLIAWIGSLRADLIFGWRQLVKRPVISIAAVLSLALAIGSCASVFRIIDAIFLRPLPIQNPEHLYAMQLRGVGPDGSMGESDWGEYPQFSLMRAAVKGEAELIAVSGVERTDLTFGSEAEMESAHLQFVSGWMFQTFGLKPSIGRLLTEQDDLKFKASPYAVISYDYWSRRFGRDPKTVGRTFHIANEVYEVIGVAPEGFTGTDTGIFTDIFLPNMMNEGVRHVDWAWIRTFVQMMPQGRTERVRGRLQSIWTAFQSERAKEFTSWPADRIKRFLQRQVLVQPAAAGLSYMQQAYRKALIAIGVIVVLVLLIACSNVANLLIAQAAARAREMALRVSIGLFAVFGDILVGSYVRSAWREQTV